MTPELRPLLDNLNARAHRDYLEKATFEQVEEYLRENPNDGDYRKLGLAELEKRRFELLQKEEFKTLETLRKSHRIHLWILVIAILTLICAAIAAADPLLKWIRGH